MKKIVAALCGLLFAVAGCTRRDPQPQPEKPAAPVLQTANAKQAVSSCGAAVAGGTTCTLDRNGTNNIVGDTTLYKLDADGLNASGAAYDADTASTNYGAASEMCVGAAGGFYGTPTTPEERRAAIRFNTSATGAGGVLPNNVVVTSATLTLNAIRGKGINANATLATLISLHRIESGVRDWTQSADVAPNDSQVCCVSPAFSINWTPSDVTNAAGFCNACVGPGTNGRHGGPCGMRRFGSGVNLIPFATTNGTNLRFTDVDVSSTEYVAAASKTVTIGAVGAVAFDSLEADIRAWYTTPSANRGWVIIATTNSGVGATPLPVVFSTSETTAGTPPHLDVTYKKAPGQACTVSSECALANGTAGLCVGNICCNVSSCSDGVLCTTDACTAGTGACTFTNNAIACNDSNACTFNDVCSAGTCGGTGVTCTSDTCNTRACNGTSSCTVTPINNGGACNDANNCTFTDICSAGTCAGTAITCTSDTCNTRACNGTSSCTVTPINNGGACNDANNCTFTDICSAGTCAGTAITCTGDTCNSRACNGTSSCTVTPINNGGACNDANNLHLTDTCMAPAPCRNGHHLHERPQRLRHASVQRHELLHGDTHQQRRGLQRRQQLHL